MNALTVTHHVPIQEVERLYKSEPKSKQARRFFAILQLYEGKTLSETALITRVSRRIVQSWVHRWNTCGSEGLKAKPQPGRPPVLTEAEEKELVQDILALPRAHGYEFSTWLLKDIAGHVQRKFGKKLTLSGVWRLLQRHKITRLVPRPMPAKADPKKKQSSWNGSRN